MVVEERTKRKDTAQQTKEETRALGNFLRFRYGMTPTEVSGVVRQHGAATIGMLQQWIHEGTLASALPFKKIYLVLNFADQGRKFLKAFSSAMSCIA